MIDKCMENNKIVGRQKERALMEALILSDKPELVAIYGRRRVGKTFLVKQHFVDRMTFCFSGTYQASRSTQLALFAREINIQFNIDVDIPKDWFSAFDLLRRALENNISEKKIVFIDELPWLDTPKSNFIQAFSFFWNTWGSTQSDLKLFVCGSATTWMLDKLIGDKGGLYGRVTRQIYLSPFSLRETELFLSEIKQIFWDRMQILNVYMVLGGIPYYLNMIDKQLSLESNIDQLFFAKGAPLRSEFNFLYRSLFGDKSMAKQVVIALSEKLKGLTREELCARLKIKQNGNLTECLNNLVHCDFLRVYNSFGKGVKGQMYQLCDMFSLFYLRFVDENSGQDEQYWSNCSKTGSISVWSGYAYEQVALLHLLQIKKKLGISGVLTNSCSWSVKPFVDVDGGSWNGAQIDLTIDRNDSFVNLCEIKYSKDEYVITKEYDMILRERMSCFKHVTKTRKSLLNTFITIFGVKRNNYSGIVDSEIILDDLFVD